jgi:hypothetical protein
LPERPAAYVTGEMLIADGGYVIGYQRRARSRLVPSGDCVDAVLYRDHGSIAGQFCSP